ncbi:MAG TPA: undecaprenyl-diphosphate phosphatase [Gemmatimonadales bacterium]|nr:undecaprenyl-diphosphate phosphatase [Gemmatimonadales bacterium]
MELSGLAQLDPLIKAAILGVVEGATEFIPVSSTGHLIVVGDWLGFDGPGAKSFEIVIQLGAILAIVWIYRARLAKVLVTARRNPASQQLLWNLALAMLPAALVGLFTHEAIKRYLFNPDVVAVAFIAGGLIIIAIERWRPAMRIRGVDDIPPRTALGVGMAQVLSLVPGTSRSAATIMGGYCLGLSREAATEFSFFLAIPVMLAATGFELATNHRLLDASDAPVLVVGFLCAFLTALVVVRAFLRYVARNTFIPFAWYRIAFGVLLLLTYGSRFG